MNLDLRLDKAGFQAGSLVTIFFPRQSCFMQVISAVTIPGHLGCPEEYGHMIGPFSSDSESERCQVHLCNWNVKLIKDLTAT